MNTIKDIINNFIDNRIGKEKIYSEVGVVKSVNENGKVCNVTLLDDTEVEDIRLETNLSINASGDVIHNGITGFVLVPAVGSQVIVTFLNSSDAFVSMLSSVDRVYIKSNICTFNTGDKGGLINIVDLVSKLNSLVNSLNTELTKIQVGITGAGGSYTPGTIDQFNKDDFEDGTIIH